MDILIDAEVHLKSAYNHQSLNLVSYTAEGLPSGFIDLHLFTTYTHKYTAQEYFSSPTSSSATCCLCTPSPLCPEDPARGTALLLRTPRTTTFPVRKRQLLRYSLSFRIAREPCRLGCR